MLGDHNGRPRVNVAGNYDFSRKMLSNRGTYLRESSSCESRKDDGVTHGKDYVRIWRRALCKNIGYDCGMWNVFIIVYEGAWEKRIGRKKGEKKWLIWVTKDEARWLLLGNASPLRYFRIS